MIGIIYLLIVLGLSGLSFWVSDRDFRIAALIMLIGSFGTTLVYALARGDWGDGMPLVFMIDILATISFVTLALQSRHFWPIWLGGFQIGALASHVSINIARDAMPYAMGVLQGFWAWFQIMVLVGIALQHIRRAGLMRR